MKPRFADIESGGTFSVFGSGAAVLFLIFIGFVLRAKRTTIKKIRHARTRTHTHTHEVPRIPIFLSGQLHWGKGEYFG